LESEAIIEPDSVIGLAIGHPQVMYFSLFAICILGVALGFVGVVDARHASEGAKAAKNSFAVGTNSKDRAMIRGMPL
jgi:hypothetical protein